MVKVPAYAGLGYKQRGSTLLWASRYAPHPCFNARGCTRGRLQVAGFMSQIPSFVLPFAFSLLFPPLAREVPFILCEISPFLRFTLASRALTYMGNWPMLDRAAPGTGGVGHPATIRLVALLASRPFPSF